MDDDLLLRVENIEATSHALAIALTMLYLLDPSARTALANHVEKAMDLGLGLPLKDCQLELVQQTLKDIAGMR